MTFKIEKGVPMPARGKVAAPCPYPFADMALGDSFAVPLDGTDGNSVRSRLLNFAKRFRDDECATFAITTALDGTSIRCWRVEYRELKHKPKALAKPAAVVHRLASAEDDDDDNGSAKTPIEKARERLIAKGVPVADVPARRGRPPRDRDDSSTDAINRDMPRMVQGRAYK